MLAQIAFLVQVALSRKQVLSEAAVSRLANGESIRSCTSGYFYDDVAECCISEISTAPVLSCPQGGVLANGYCVAKSQPSLRCRAGFTFNGTSCAKVELAPMIPSCSHLDFEASLSDNGAFCIYSEQVPTVPHCNDGVFREMGGGRHGGSCFSSEYVDSLYMRTCPNGWELVDGEFCEMVENVGCDGFGSIQGSLDYLPFEPCNVSSCRVILDDGERDRRLCNNCDRVVVPEDVCQVKKCSMKLRKAKRAKDRKARLNNHRNKSRHFNHSKGIVSGTVGSSPVYNSNVSPPRGSVYVEDGLEYVEYDDMINESEEGRYGTGSELLGRVETYPVVCERVTRVEAKCECVEGVVADGSCLVERAFEVEEVCPGMARRAGRGVCLADVQVESDHLCPMGYEVACSNKGMSLSNPSQCECVRPTTEAAISFCADGSSPGVNGECVSRYIPNRYCAEEGFELRNDVCIGYDREPVRVEYNVQFEFEKECMDEVCIDAQHRIKKVKKNKQVKRIKGKNVTMCDVTDCVDSRGAVRPARRGLVSEEEFNLA